MRVAIIVIALLTIFFIIILSAGQNIYTLQSEKTEFENVITWMKNLKKANQPIPVYTDKIRFTTNTISLGTVSYFYSASSTFWGSVQRSGDADNPVLQVQWYDNDGVEVGIFSDKLTYDLPQPVYHVDPLTQRLISVDFLNRVRIISPEGKVLNGFNIRDEYQYHSENIFSAELVDNSLFTAATEISPRANDAPGYNSYIRIVDLEGETEMSYDLTGWQVRAAKASESGHFFAVSFYRRNTADQTFDFQTLILNRDGVVLNRLPFRFRQAFFSDNTKRILLLDKDSGYLLDISSEEPVSKFKVKDVENLFMSATFLGSSGMLAVEEGKLIAALPGSPTPWAYTNVHIRTFDQKGIELDDRLLEKVKIYTSAIWYNDQSETLFIGHSNGWQLYRVNY